MEPAAPFPGLPYRLRCTLTFGDIYGQILIWMLVIFASLAAGLALMGASKPIFALVGVGGGEFWYCPCPSCCLPSPLPCSTTLPWSQTQTPKGLPRLNCDRPIASVRPV